MKVCSDLPFSRYYGFKFLDVASTFKPHFEEIKTVKTREKKIFVNIMYTLY